MVLVLYSDKMKNPSNVYSRLINPYSIVRGYEEILEGVRLGEAKFQEELKKRNLSRAYQIFTGDIAHTHDDTRVHAFTLAIPSIGNLEEITLNAFLSFAAHFIDDVFDRPDLGPSTEKMYGHRRDIKKLLDSMGDVGKFGHLMADQTPHPEAVYKGIQRLVYGELIQRAKTQEQQDIYLVEYKKLSLKGISPAVKKDIQDMRNILYWLTNKSPLDIWFAAEPKFDPTLAELWTLVSCPALYYHDAEQEEEEAKYRIEYRRDFGRSVDEINQEVPNFFGRKRPTDDEMIFMINIAAKHLKGYKDERASLRLEQLRFLIKTSANVLPEKLYKAYHEVERKLSE